MVDVGAKPPVARRAVAEGFLCAAPQTLDLLESGLLPKGEALAAARVAGIMGAKRCPDLVPLCHVLPIDEARVDFERAAPDRLRVETAVSTTAKTGVEMEALCAAAVALLALYDMAKGVDKAMRLEGIRLVSKNKGGPAA